MVVRAGLLEVFTLSRQRTRRPPGFRGELAQCVRIVDADGPCFRRQLRSRCNEPAGPVLWVELVQQFPLGEVSRLRSGGHSATQLRAAQCGQLAGKDSHGVCAGPAPVAPSDAASTRSRLKSAGWYAWCSRSSISGYAAQKFASRGVSHRAEKYGATLTSGSCRVRPEWRRRRLGQACAARWCRPRAAWPGFGQDDLTCSLRNSSCPS